MAVTVCKFAFEWSCPILVSRVDMAGKGLRCRRSGGTRTGKRLGEIVVQAHSRTSPPSRMGWDWDSVIYLPRKATRASRAAHAVPASPRRYRRDRHATKPVTTRPCLLSAPSPRPMVRQREPQRARNNPEPSFIRELRTPRRAARFGYQRALATDGQKFSAL